MSILEQREPRGGAGCVVTVRLVAAEKRLIEEAALKARVSMNWWLVRAAVAAAKAELAFQKPIDLGGGI